MPRSPAVHYNPVGPTYDGESRCGRKLAKIQWSTVPERVTCLACKKAMQ